MSDGRVIEVTVWNATVANLTLMALGSSAPEILLSMIEISSSGFFAGELGPSTIVGSAAFNLLGISAVCVLAIPSGSGRFIKDRGVFYITATSSVFAYLWLIIILQLSTPNVVDIWEGSVTFILFPLLVVLAYKADIGRCCSQANDEDGAEAGEDGGCVELGKYGEPVLIGYQKLKDEESGSGQEDDAAAARAAKLKAKIAKALEETQLWDGKAPDAPPSEAVTSAISKHLQPPASKAYYRAQATRGATGGAVEALGRPLLGSGSHAASGAPPPSVIEFDVNTYAFSEGEEYALLSVRRRGNEDSRVEVRYATEAGTAEGAGKDYHDASGTLVFAPGVTVQEIRVQLVNDDEEEDDETFYVRLSKPTPRSRCQLGAEHTAAVTIIDDDGPGVLAFERADGVSVSESDGNAVIVVKRVQGTRGELWCRWQTVAGSALEGEHYAKSSGELRFPAHGALQQRIIVPLVDQKKYDKEVGLFVELESPQDAQGQLLEGAARFAGDVKTLSVPVTVTADPRRKQQVDQLAAALEATFEAVRLSPSTYAQQFRSAVKYEGEGPIDFAMYVLSLPWKVLFAVVPPPTIMGGWLCFCVALVGIGGLTALIGDLASQMGCCMGLLPSVTAITFVALGTSLPDTFASKTAAVNEAHADASIGNITGSNSVNVFLGLGMPWMAAAIYWTAFATDDAITAWRARYANEPWYDEKMPVGFVVPAGDLGFSVAVFSACAVTCLCVLMLRRAIVGFELGGPDMLKYLTAVFFVGLWLVYVAASAAQAYGVDVMAYLGLSNLGLSK